MIHEDEHGAYNIPDKNDKEELEAFCQSYDKFNIKACINCVCNNYCDIFSINGKKIKPITSCDIFALSGFDNCHSCTVKILCNKFIMKSLELQTKLKITPQKKYGKRDKNTLS